MFSAYRATVSILPENKKDCIILQPWLSFNDYTFLTVYFSDPIFLQKLLRFHTCLFNFNNYRRKINAVIYRNLKLFFQRVLELNSEGDCQFIESYVCSALCRVCDLPPDGALTLTF